MKCLSFLPWTLVTLLIIFGGNYGSHSDEKNRPRRNINQAQPRMSSEGGNLIFHTGSAQNIEFRTGSQGRIKLNEEDLADVFSQIQRNKGEILELKRLTSTPFNVSNEIIQLQSQIVNIEDWLHNLEMTFLKKVCNSNPCQNSGTCINLLDAFFCLCPNNWQGPDCSVDVNECQIYEGTSLGCQNGATCVNNPGNYSCICTPETYGQYCTSKFDDCQGRSSLLCGHGVCVDGNREQLHQPNYTCICEDGWMSPPGSLACNADIDECSFPNPPCSVNPPVRCINMPGFYFCDPCPAGYEGDGKVCTLVNICSVNNGGCHPLAVCNSISGPVPNCVCPDGYTGNGYGSNGCFSLSIICQTHNPCVNGQCLDTVSGYKCVCEPGWIGTNCSENIGECSINPCYCGGSCITGVNGYSCEYCGGSFSGSSGSFSYPNNSGYVQYDHQVNCNWVIRTYYNKILHVTFSFFHLEGSVGCIFNYLQIHDGDSTSANLLGKYCGPHKPEQLFSSQNSLYFSFHSDRMISGRGFTVHWESQESECGGKLTSTYGIINSPGYPGNYPPNKDCYWIISTNPGLLITFAFGLLSLEHHDNCTQDYLEIRDGLLSQDPLLGKYCTTGLPPPLQTTGPYAWVQFHSNSFDDDKGFLITYITSPADPNCGGNYTNSSGIIMSPYWSSSYLNNRQCVYIIRQPPNEKIYLNFTHLELEGHPNCTRNYIEIRDGDTERAPLINKFCGSMLPSAITSNQNSLWIKFKSDISVTTSNFRATYEVACGGSLFGEGVIRSPYFMRPLPKGRICEWIIFEPEDSIVILTFTNFRIYNVTTCNSDYVEIRNGGNAIAPSLGKYCGNIIPPVVHSRHNSLYIKFRASSTTNLGFMAEYKPFDIVCSHEYTTASGMLTSPNYPHNYPDKMVCIYKIHVANNKQIALHFTNFSLEEDAMCVHDYLEIRNGGFETSPLLGKYCGSSLPPITISHSNNLWIKFVSDMYLTSTGFSAYWNGTSTGCGGILTTSSGILMSPNYPMPYYKNVECYWLLKSSHGNVFEIYFDQFHLATDPSCYSDYLAVYDGNSSTSNMLGKFCGDQTLPTMRSTGNNMYIILRTGHSLNGRGFLAHFKQVCQGIVIANHSQGILESLDYPNNYPPGVYCNWTIQTTTGNTLDYSFKALSTKGGDRCGRDHLKLYDGPNAQSTLIGTFCGDSVLPSGGTTNSSLHVVFFSDQIDESTGFQMLWKVNDTTKSPPRR